jgi:hypothetical protein
LLKRERAQDSYSGLVSLARESVIVYEQGLRSLGSRLFRAQEVPSSNLGAPASYFFVFNELFLKLQPRKAQILAEFLYLPGADGFARRVQDLHHLDIEIWRKRILNRLVVPDAI